MSRLFRFGLAALVFLAAPFSAYAQGIITTVAGTTWIFRGDGGPAVNAPLGSIWGVAVDSAGNVYASDSNNSLVVKISLHRGHQAKHADEEPHGGNSDGNRSQLQQKET
jgi:hypothetical protein